MNKRTTTARAIAALAMGSTIATATSAQDKAAPARASVEASSTPGAQVTTIDLSLSKRDWVSNESFTNVAGMRVLSNLSVLVADAREPAVHMLSSRGQSVRQLGRKGDGPGEYTSPTHILPLPGDSTIVVDKDARRTLLIAPDGKLVRTTPLPRLVANGAGTMAFADARGRLYYGERLAESDNPADVSRTIHRWTRTSDRSETVASYRVARQSAPQKISTSFESDLKGTTRVVYGASDDWVIAPSGNVGIIHANPYRVDWIASDGKTMTGATIAYTPIPVTEDDRRAYEPQGPPYVRTYAAQKPPFEEMSAIVDNAGNLFVARSAPFGATTRLWDVVSPAGKHLNTVTLPITRNLRAVTATHVYAVFTDSNDLLWVERYRR
jgi:hypothetical protein